ncbi:hypothetical protein F4680DRAFT_421592 [Xylaria scruposa]|nr:hypothetical protein F4680DRAFT_421592 [Xylaria scruposa]
MKTFTLLALAAIGLAAPLAVGGDKRGLSDRASFIGIYNVPPGAEGETAEKRALTRRVNFDGIYGVAPGDEGEVAEKRALSNRDTFLGPALYIVPAGEEGETTA